jgi:hypothetical protein
LPESTSLPLTTEAYTGVPDDPLILSAIACRSSPAAIATSTDTGLAVPTAM